jgi:ATP-dependent RNA helicase RhlE
MIEVARRNSTVEIITQKVHPVDRDRKRELLSHLIKTQNWHQVLVFTRTKHGANKLAEQLNDDGITALAIHGNKSQSARTRALAEFKDGDLQVLVATDIAARGIDIDQLPHVVNYDLPNVPEDYVHRIGRTGRAGATGEAISLVCVDERDFLRDIERLIKREIPSVVVAGFTPDPSARPQPILQRQQRGGPSGHSRGGQPKGHPRARQNNAAATTKARGTGQAAGHRGGNATPRTASAGGVGGASAGSGARPPAARKPGDRPPAVRRFGGKSR